LYYGDFVLKNVFAGLTTFALASLLAFENREMLKALDPKDFSALAANTDLQVIVFLALVSLFLFLSKSSKQELTEERSVEPKGEVQSADQPQKSNSSNAAVIYFLSLLQEKGRLLDFVMDDVSPYSDEQVGQVARVVHKGIGEALRGTIEIEALHEGKEGDSISVSEQYNAQTYRFVGKLKEKPPISGIVLHRGWKAKNISLPESNIETNVVHPMEIEVS
jgi:hypothetical protein